MARKSKLSATEIAELENAEYQRREIRKTGFQKMKERDLGYGRLRDYNGHKAVWMDWRMTAEYESDQLFKMVIGSGDEKITIVLDAEEVRKHLRWV